MKQVLACVSLCALVFLTGCTQSSEKLVEAANKYHEKKEYDRASILYQKAIAKNKLNADAYYREGLNLLDQGKIPDAVNFLRRAVDLKPDNIDAANKLSEIYLTAYQHDPNRYKSLLDDVKSLDDKMLAKSPNSYEALRIKALYTLAQGKPEEALPIFAQANQIKPYSRDLMGWYAQAYRQAQQSDKALGLVNDMLAHDKTWPQGYQFLFLYYEQMGDKQKAEQALRDNAKNDPKSAIAVENYANFLARNGRVAEGETAIRQTLNDSKTFPNARLLVGDYDANTKQFDKAATEYQTGAKEDAKNAVTYQERLVALNAARNNSGEAARLAKELVDEHPKDASANEMYASVLLETGQKSDAAKSLASLKALVEKNPSDSVLHLDLARAYFSTNDRDKALNEAMEAIRLEQKATSTPPRLRVLIPAQILAARVNEDRGQHGKALELAEAILQNQPNNPEARLIRDQAWVGTDHSDKALPDLEALVKQYPNLNDPRLELGLLYLVQKKFDQAREQYQAVAGANPPDIRGFFGLQTVKIYTGKSDEALSAIQDLVDKNPTILPYRYKLANFQAEVAASNWSTNPPRSKELLQKAADNYKEILKTTANSSEIWFRLGAMQRQLMQYDSALASFEQATNADPKNAAAFLSSAVIYEALGRKKDATTNYNKVLAIDPDNALVLNNLAYMEADSGNPALVDQALTYAERAKKRVPDSPDISDTLGFVYYKKDLNTEALRIFRQISQAHPDNPTFHLHLGMALLKSGDKQGARDEANKALQSATTPDQKDRISRFVSQIG